MEPFCLDLRLPLESYLEGREAKVYSLVVGLPFSPLDFDIGRLARGEWNSMTDRFRLWYIPAEEGVERPSCYLMVRKFDPRDGVLLYCHVVVDLTGGTPSSFYIGIMSNDEVRANAMLGSVLGVPPSYHGRKEVRVVERRWRSDSDAVTRFLANFQSVMSGARSSPGGGVRILKFQPSPGMMRELKRSMAAWWTNPVAESESQKKSPGF